MSRDKEERLRVLCERVELCGREAHALGLHMAARILEAANMKLMEGWAAEITKGATK